MRLFEGADAACAVATGMAAVTALADFIPEGRAIMFVAARAMFGSCRYVIDEMCPALWNSIHSD